jgi:hypothetical protein
MNRQPGRVESNEKAEELERLDNDELDVKSTNL